MRTFDDGKEHTLMNTFFMSTRSAGVTDRHKFVFLELLPELKTFNSGVN